MLRLNLIASLLLIGGFLACVLPARAALQLFDTVDFRERQGRSLDENVLKLHGLAIDASRNLVYSAGIMSAHIGVLDGATESWVRTANTGAGGLMLKYLEVDPVANRLYVNDATNATLRAIDLASGALVGPIAIAGTVARPVADTRRGLVYLTQPSAPTFLAYRGSDLALSYSTNDMGAGAAQAIYDEAADRVYVLDAATPGSLKIYTFDPNARRVERTLTLALAGNTRPYRMVWDSTGQRFFVIAGGEVLAVAGSGSLLGRMPLNATQTTKDISFDPDRREVAVLVLDRAANGTQADSGGHLRVFSADSFSSLADLAFGHKPSGVSYNRGNRRYYAAEGDASTVWSIPGGAASATALRLGDSAEMITLARGGESVFLPSRLGGNYLIEWKAATSSLATFSAGFWPIPARSNSAGNMLYVLNAWDSTLSVFNLASARELLATLPLGLPKGSTDRLPDLAIDSTRQRAYAAYPEFGQIAVVNLATGGAMTPISVPNFQTGDVGGGPGQLQVRVFEATGRLFAYWGGKAHLTVWDVSGSAPTLLLDRNLPGMSAATTTLDQLFLDAGNNRVYAGPMEIDALTGQPTGRNLARGERVIGLDEAGNALWTAGVEIVSGAAHDVVNRLDRASLALLESSDLGAVPLAMNTQYAFDPTRQRLYAADGQAARMRVYSASADSQAARSTAVEFHHAGLQHYFITADSGEARAIDKGAAGAGWTRTGQAFYAYPASGAALGTSPVCRFYGTPGVGPNSHFYTASAGECEQVKASPGWTYEGLAFAIGTPDRSGACAAGQSPVYRAYNGRWAQNDSNHRYSADAGIYGQMQAQGWSGEGVVFCAPN